MEKSELQDQGNQAQKPAESELLPKVFQALQKLEQVCAEICGEVRAVSREAHALQSDLRALREEQVSQQRQRYPRLLHNSHGRNKYASLYE